MLKVLIALKDLRIGNGIASCIMSYYNGMVESGIQVDFLLLQSVPSTYMEQVEKKSRIYVMPTAKYKYSVKTAAFLKSFFQENQYDIVHVNLTGPYGAWILKTAARYNIKHRIYHCHNPRDTRSVKSRLSSGLYNALCVKRADTYLACSSAAGESVFGEREFTVLRNCIDVRKYAFNEKARNELRSELQLGDSTLLIGAVGRLEDQKNPLFALKCFAVFAQKHPDSRFIWIGDGSMRQDAERTIRELHIEEKAHLLGVKQDVQKWYSAMDVLLLPSRFEGLGIVYIEAQASGLTCIGSEGVPKDTEVTPLMHRISLDADIDTWADAIAGCRRIDDRLEAQSMVSASGYDTASEKGKLAEIYRRIGEQ